MPACAFSLPGQSYVLLIPWWGGQASLSLFCYMLTRMEVVGLCVGVCMCACECVGVYTLVSMLVCQGVHIHLYAHVSVCVLVCISMHVLMFHILYPSFRNITSMVGSITFHFNLLNIYDYGLWQERKREKGRQGEIVWTSECYLIVNIFKKHTWNVT